MQRIAASDQFVHAGSLTQFLHYIVEQALEGNGQSLKEYTLGVEVYHRGVDFDPKRDTIVRVQARTLRSRLASYYENEGRVDPVRISVPKGTYAPVFELSSPEPNAAHATMLPYSKSRATGIALRAAGIALCLIALVWIVSKWTQPPRLHSCATLAVFGFEDESARAPLFAPALTQGLLTRLSEIPKVTLVALDSVARSRETRRSLTDSGAVCVVDGTVGRFGDELRVHIRLKDGATERTFWEGAYQRPVADLPELESELARAVAIQAGYASTRTADVATKPVRVDTEAALLYFEARQEFNKGTEEGYRRSIELYSRSVQHQPDYAVAHAGLSLAWFKYAFNMFAPPNEAMPKAKAAAERALQLDPALAEALAVLGAVHLFYDWQPVAAYTRLRQALTLAPNLSLANEIHAVFNLATGRFDEAAASAQRARESDPLSVPLMVISEFISLASRRYEDGTQYGLKAVAREPNVGLLRALFGMNLIYSGREAEGLEQLSAGLRLEANPAVELLSAGGYARVGDNRRAHELLAQAKEKGRHRYVCAYEVASVHAVLGESDEAFQWFDKAIADRCDCMVWLNIEPWLDRIRGDPRFEQLIRRVAFK